MPLLFSYGTLRHKEVQVATFGRILLGAPDELVGFALSTIEIADPEFVATSGKARHAIVRQTGEADHRVPGVVLEVTDKELAQADAYEPAGYRRITTTLASGREAWVYAADS